MGHAQRRHLGRRRPRRLRAEGRRSAARVVADRHQRRRLEILSRTARHAAARDQRAPAHLARRRYHHRMGREAANTSPDAEARETFHAELTYLLLNQKASFNSPVYFNVGIEAKPQCSACFILKVEDSMDSILSWYRNEGMIFKGGSGAGVNLSALRSCREKLSAGGTASGPLSFMKAADAIAGVIKSGGKTRRAAKMVVLNADHPDIVDFIKCKVEEEKKAWALIEAGYDCLARRPRLQLGVFPKRQQLRARDRRIHAGGRRRRRMAARASSKSSEVAEDSAARATCCR